MNQDRLNQMADALEAYLQSKTISQKALADQIGISAAYITHALRRNWTKIPAGNGRESAFSEQIARKILLFLGVGTKVWDIDNYITIQTILFEAKKYQEHRIIDGLKGTGKSFACAEFLRQHPGETFLIKCSEDMNPKAFIQELAYQVGVDQLGDRRRIRMAVCDKIKTMTYPLIMIDEAENLKPAAYGAIKAIYDEVKDYCGIVLIGANNYLDTLRKRANAGKGCFPQIYSRFSADPGLLALPTKDDVKTICHVNNLFDKELINTIYDTCSDYREIDRKVKRILRDNQLKGAAA